MSNPVLIELSLVNVPSGLAPLSPTDVYDFIESRVDGVETYQLDPRHGGAAAIDYTILYVAGSIASIGTGLWAAYKEFVAPRKQRETDRGGIYVVMRRGDGTVAEFFIGEAYRNRDIFIGDFETAMSKIHDGVELPKEQKQRIQQIRQSGLWIRRK
jgi:hypothetical protein